MSAHGRTARSLVAVLLAAVLGPTEGRGQVLRPRLEIAPYAGALLPGNAERLELDDAPLFGARAGLLLPGGLGVEGQFGYAPLDVTVRGAAGAREFDLGATLLEGGLVYAFPLPGPLTPFVGASAGRMRFGPDLEVAGKEVERESSFVLSGGVGLRLSLGGVNLRGDLRDHVVFGALEETNRALGGERGETIQAIEASLGISFLF